MAAVSSKGAVDASIWAWISVVGNKVGEDSVCGDGSWVGCNRTLTVYIICGFQRGCSGFLFNLRAISRDLRFVYADSHLRTDSATVGVRYSPALHSR